MEIILSRNLSSITDAGNIPLTKTIMEEFVSYEDSCKKLIVRLTEPKNDFIVPLEGKKYLLFLGVDTVTSFRENEPLMRGKIKHEAGHLKYILRDPIPSPGLMKQIKSFFGLGVDVDKIEFTSKLALQNTLIDMDIVSRSKRHVVDAYIQNYLQEHTEDIEKIPPKDSDNFSSFCASIMQRTAVAKHCTKRPWFDNSMDHRLRKIIKMTYGFRDDTFQGLERKRFDLCVNVLADSKKKYDWKPFGSLFSSLIGVQKAL